LPSSTPSPKPTLSATVTKPPTRTFTPTKAITNTPVRTSTNTPTITPTRTPTLTFTSTFTPTITLTPSPTPAAPSDPPCGSVSLSPLTNQPANELSMDITNNSGSDITINRFFAYWVKSPNSQKIARLLLNGTVIWNTSDPTSPSDFPTESPFVGGAAALTIPNGTPGTSFVIQFQNILQPTGYEVHIVFGPPVDCQVIGIQ
ncbi:MAG: hypothetical protein ABI986_02525, partial [Chloroflexota bacterium]